MIQKKIIRDLTISSFQIKLRSETPVFSCLIVLLILDNLLNLATPLVPRNLDVWLNEVCVVHDTMEHFPKVALNLAGANEEHVILRTLIAR